MAIKNTTEAQRKIESIALDEWTDSISGNHHVCILFWTREDRGQRNILLGDQIYDEQNIRKHLQRAFYCEQGHH